MRKTALITGANRGIGLGLAQMFLRKGYSVIGTARNPHGARDLWELEHDYKEQFRVIELDVTKTADLEALSKELKNQTLDVLVNSAGVCPEYNAPFVEVSVDGMLKAFTANVLGPLRVTQAVLPSLQKAPHAIVATISSRMGSIADNTSGSAYAYRTSKAAVNMLNKSLSLEFPDMISVVLHPGWVQTEMGGASATTSVHDSTEGLYNVISGLKPADNGHFFDFRGHELPW